MLPFHELPCVTTPDSVTVILKATSRQTRRRLFKRWLCHVLSRTGGHFACACVNPLNDNSVGASNLMAGNRKLARKITVLLKAISLVL